MRSGSPAAAPQFVFGVVVMVLGLILGLDSLGVADAGYILRFWPAGLIVLGLGIATRPEPGVRFWGFFWLLVGSWLLMRNLGVIHVGFWQLFWPLLLVWIGGSVVLKTLRQSGYLPVNPDPADRMIAVLSECKRNFDGKPFDGATMTGFMGGCILDLRRALVAPGETRAVDVFGMMVGYQIKVPPEWSVTLDVMPIMGETKDKRAPLMTPPPLGGAAAPTLVVRGSVVMGEVKITD